jgi:hypothetical protein
MAGTVLSPSRPPPVGGTTSDGHTRRTEETMKDTPLRFNEVPYHPNDLGNLLAHFRDDGFVVLRNVFERDSVDDYLAAVREAIVRTDAGAYELPDDSPLVIAPTCAPRIRQVLPGALSPSVMPPHPALFEVSWLIRPVGEEAGGSAWHKDRDHANVRREEYHYPHTVHVGMYFTDMTPEHGPTEVILGSHRDPALTPCAPSAKPAQAVIRKEDAFLWDQAIWHRSTRRTIPGMRVFALFGFYGAPIYDGTPYRMKRAQRRAWREARDPYEQILYGGAFVPGDD